jgi:hypothetical protein
MVCIYIPNKKTHEDHYLLGYNAMQSGEVHPCFGKNILPLFSRLKSKPRKGANTLVAAYLAYFPTLKVEAACSSKTSINFYQTIQNHISGNSTLHSHSHENLNLRK